MLPIRTVLIRGIMVNDILLLRTVLIKMNQS